MKFFFIIAILFLSACEPVYKPGDLQARDAIVNKCKNDCAPYKPIITKYVGSMTFNCTCEDNK